MNLYIYLNCSGIHLICTLVRIIDNILCVSFDSAVPLQVFPQMMTHIMKTKDDSYRKKIHLMVEYQPFKNTFIENSFIFWRQFLIG